MVRGSTIYDAVRQIARAKERRTRKSAKLGEDDAPNRVHTGGRKKNGGRELGAAEYAGCH